MGTPYPHQEITVIDPGLGLVTPAPDAPFLTGWATGGSLSEDELFSISSLNTIRSAVGYGPLAEDIAKTLSERGGPVLAMLSSAGETGVISAVTNSGGTSGTVTVTGIPTEIFTARIECTAAGTRGVGKFRYTLDYHEPDIVSETWSAERTIPAGGTFSPSGSGLTFSFAAASYTLDQTWDFTARAPEVTTTDLSDTSLAIQELASILFPLWIMSGSYLDEQDASAVAQALSTHLTTLGTGNRYARGILDIGSGATSGDVLTEGDNWSSRLVVPCYGYCLQQSVLPFEGFTWRKCSAQSPIGVRASRVLPSTDLSRFAEGSLNGVGYIYFDGNADRTLDAAGFATLRRHPGIPAYYISNGRLRAPLGSDFTDLQFGRVVDIACRGAYEAQLPFLGEGFRTQADGTLDPNERADIMTAGNDKLAELLLRPKNARGRPGHVSSVSYEVSATHNLNTTSEVLSDVAIRPLGYSKVFKTTVGLRLNTGVE